MLTKLLHTFERLVHQAKDTQPEQHRVRYGVTAKNTSSSEKQISILVPTPPKAREHQLLIEEPMFGPTAQVESDTVFGNQYAVWNTTLAAGEEKKFVQSFVVLVEPIQPTETNFLVSDYPAAIKRDALAFTANCLGTNAEELRSLAAHARGKQNRIDAVLKLFNEYVIEHLEYGDPIPGLYSASEALEKKIVDCGGFDTLLASLCALSGIPARVVSGFWAGYEKNEMHAWLEIALPDGTWIPADPSVEKLARANRTKKVGGLGEIGSDRIALSIGCGIPVHIGETEHTIDILQTPLLFPESAKGDVTLTWQFETEQ